MADASPPMPLPVPAPFSRRSLRTPLHWLGVIALSLGVAVGAAMGWEWWQDRPLREAERQLSLGNAARALALSEYFLDLHPASGRAEAVRARAFTDLGRADEAAAIYERVGAATAEDLRAWARANMIRESWTRAIPLLEQLLRLRPDDTDALYELTTCRTRVGAFREAFATAERFAAQPGQAARGELLLAAIQGDTGNTDEAILAFGRAMTLAPDGVGLQIPPEEFFVQYGTLLLKQGRAGEAVGILEKSLAANPTAAAHHLLGKALSQTGSLEEARRQWLAAIDLDPAGVSPREDLAALALASGDAAAAREWLTPLEVLAGRRSETAYLFQRLAALEKDEAAFARWKETTDGLRVGEKRISSLEQMMATAPTSYWAQTVRAHKFATLGNWQQAADLINGIEKADDEHPFVTELREAVRTRGPLPAIDQVPLKEF